MYESSYTCPIMMQWPSKPQQTNELKYIHTDFFTPQTLNSQRHNPIKRMQIPNTGFHKLIFMSESMDKQKIRTDISLIISNNIHVSLLHCIIFHYSTLLNIQHMQRGVQRQGPCFPDLYQMIAKMLNKKKYSVLRTT